MNSIQLEEFKTKQTITHDNQSNDYKSIGCIGNNNVRSNHNNSCKQQQLDLTPRSAQVRNILHLPLPPLTDYSPYPGLEFDGLVQEYCRIQHAHAKLTPPPNDHDNTKLKKTTRIQRLASFDSDNGISDIAQRYQNAMRWPLSTNKSLRSCKVIVSGDVAVGKTCLVNRFGHDVYTNKYQTTIGVDFDIQKYNILGMSYAMQIWDTAGLERFRSINSSYYRGCQAALLVFDMTNMSSMANLVRWKEEILAATKTHSRMMTDQTNLTTTNRQHIEPNQQSISQQPMFFLVGTKSDITQPESTRQFIRDQANKLAKLLKAELWFVSSETGENIPELFNRVAALSFNNAVMTEVRRIKFETSTIGASLKEKIMQQQKELWVQSSRLIKVTKRKDGDDRRSRCINVQCIIK